MHEKYVLVSVWRARARQHASSADIHSMPGILDSFDFQTLYPLSFPRRTCKLCLYVQLAHTKQRLARTNCTYKSSLVRTIRSYKQRGGKNFESGFHRLRVSIISGRSLINYFFWGGGDRHNILQN